MKLVYLENVTTLALASERCTGCGRCAEVCPHGVFALSKKQARILERDLCMECGACANNCPVKAITVRAGVGCAAAFVTGWLTGSEPTCDCSGSDCC